MPSLEQKYELFDDPRYLESKGPDHEAYGAMANRLQNFHISPEKWPKPERYRLERPLTPRLPVGARGINHPQDVADLSDGLLALGGLGLSGWLPRTHVPNSKLNAAIAEFQRLNNLTPDGLVNPDGPTIKVLNGYLTLPQAPETMARAYVAAALNQPPNADGKPGRPITAPGMGDEALARSRAEEARAEAAMEVERRAEDPFGDIFGGGRRSERNHIDDMLDSFEAESRAQLEREADALVGRGLLTDRSRGQDVASMGVAGAIFRNQIHLAEKSEWADLAFIDGFLKRSWTYEYRPEEPLGDYPELTLDRVDVGRYDVYGDGEAELFVHVGFVVACGTVGCPVYFFAQLQVRGCP